MHEWNAIYTYNGMRKVILPFILNNPLSYTWNHSATFFSCQCRTFKLRPPSLAPCTFLNDSGLIAFHLLDAYRLYTLGVSVGLIRETIIKRFANAMFYCHSYTLKLPWQHSHTFFSFSFCYCKHIQARGVLVIVNLSTIKVMVNTKRAMLWNKLNSRHLMHCDTFK